MADPPHNFQTIAAELQVMILTKVFEGAKINVEYPYQIARKIPYHKMQLQGNVKILLVSRSFHSAAKTALFQVATFNHDEFYFGQGRKSRRLQNAAPDAFRQFRHISGNVRFMSEFYNAYKDDRWPYTDLRSVTIGELSWSDRYKFSGSTILDHLKDLKVLQDTVSERNVKLRRPLILDEIFDYRDRTFKKMRKGFAEMHILIDGDKCHIEEAWSIPIQVYEKFEACLKDIFGSITVVPAIDPNRTDWITI